MPSSDPIADGLTKLRNASRAKHPVVDLAGSKLLQRILDVLKGEGLIRTYKVMADDRPQATLRVYLKYQNKQPLIRQVVRVSKPGQRVYRRATNLPRVLRGLGVAVVTTSQGVMTERTAYRQKVGGEVLCYVW